MDQNEVSERSRRFPCGTRSDVVSESFGQNSSPRTTTETRPGFDRSIEDFPRQRLFLLLEPKFVAGTTRSVSDDVRRFETSTSTTRRVDSGRSTRERASGRNESLETKTSRWFAASKNAFSPFHLFTSVWRIITRTDLDALSNISIDLVLFRLDSSTHRFRYRSRITRNSRQSSATPRRCQSKFTSNRGFLLFLSTREEKKTTFFSVRFAFSFSF